MGKGEIPADFEQDESGKVVLSPERFKNAAEIQDACNAMVLADSRRIGWRASIDNLVDGNPTYRFSDLKAKGQGWRARVNYRGAEGLLQARQTPFYDLVTEVNPCVDVSLDYGKGVDQSDWSNAIARHYHWMLMKGWRSGFNFHFPVQQLEMLKHGIGYHIWPGNKTSWIPRTPTTGTVLFPDGATINLKEDLDYFMLRDWLPGHAIYAYIRNEEAATKLGWNVDSVWSALAQSSKNKQRANNRWNVEVFQREMKSGDIGTTNARQSGLWLNIMFVKEIDTGKISQYTVAEGVTVDMARTGSKIDDPFRNCLFRKRNRFEDWPIVIFPYDIGRSGDIHSIRGLGARTKDFFELDNRLTNAMVDQVLVGSTMNLKQTGPVDPDKLRLMRLGMMSIIPQGLEAMQGLQFPNLAQGPIALRKELKDGIRENNESYSSGAPEPMDRETAQSFTWRAQDSAQIGKGALSLYNSNLQQFHDRVVRIISMPSAAVGSSYSAQLAREFQARCEKDGVPKEALARIYEVSERTSTGAGSPAARIQALMTIFKTIYPITTEDRKINIERDLVSALIVNSQTDRYARSHDDNQSPDNDVSLAVQENNGMMQGGDAVAASSQNQVEHLTQHLQKAEQIVQAVQQGQIDPAQALAIIQKFGEHCAQHLQILQGNPMRKQEFDQLHKEWLALSTIADQLQQQVEQEQSAAQQPTPEENISDNLKIGLAKVQAVAQIGQQKFAHKAQLDEAKFRTNTALKIRQAAVNERLAVQRNGSKPAVAAR